MTLLILLWQQIPDTAQSANGISKTELGIYVTLAGVLGAALKAFFDFITGFRKITSDIDRNYADIQKSDHEIIGNQQDKLFAANRLLMEMQEKLDKWIGRFETASEDIGDVDAELRKMRRMCHACLDTRKGYYELCIKLDEFFDRMESILITEEFEPLIHDLKNLRKEMHNLQQDVEADLKHEE